jgi:hypothetical protein
LRIGLTMALHPDHQHALDAIDNGSSVRLGNGELVSTKAEVDAHFAPHYPPAAAPAEEGGEKKEGDPHGLAGKSVAALKEQAAGLEIDGADKLNKAKLVEAITEALDAKAAAAAPAEEGGEKKEGE